MEKGAKKLDRGRIAPVEIPSSTSTSGCFSASSPSSSRTARWSRNSLWSATSSPARADSDGKTVASSARTSTSRASRRCGSSPWTYSSSASTNTQTQVALEFRRGSGEHELPVRVSPSAWQQLRLADSRLAHQGKGGRAAWNSSGDCRTSGLQPGCRRTGRSPAPSCPFLGPRIRPGHLKEISGWRIKGSPDVGKGNAAG